MSSLSQLLSFFGRAQGDELWLTIGESPYIVHSGKRTALGSHPMSAGLVFAAASELVPIDELRCLPVDRPRVVRHDHDGAEWVVEIIRARGGISLCIRRPRDADGDCSAPRLKSMQDDLRMSGPSDGACEGSTDVDVDVDIDISLTESDRAPPPVTATLGVVFDARSSVNERGSLRTALVRAVALGASDLHLSSERQAFVRIDGELRPARGVGIAAVGDLVAELRQLGGKPGALGRATRREMMHEIDGVARFRIEVFPDSEGVGASIRIVPVAVPTIDAFGLPKACIELCQLSSGLVLVNGPAGAGKSSTLAAMVDHINQNRSEHVVTLEQLTEHVHASSRSLIQQVAVGSSSRALLAAMKACSRQDANVVMLGALPDLPALSFALQMAEAGHLVFAGIDTLTAVSAIERVIAAFPGDKQGYARLVVSRALKGVVSLALCKRVAGGRVAAHEVLISTPAVAALIREGKSFQVSAIIQASKAIGMATLNESLTSLVQRQLITPKEAIVRSVDKPGLAAMLNQVSRFSSNHRLRRVNVPQDLPDRVARSR